MRYFLLTVLLFFASGSKAQDHNLDFFLTHARINSPLLKDYQNQLQSGRIDSQLIRAAYKTQVNGISIDSYAPVINGYGYDNVITNGAQLSAMVQASKTFVSSNNMAAQYQAIGLQNQSISNTSVIAEKDLKKTVTAQYILVYGDFINLNFNQEILSLFKNEESILKQLTAANTYKQSDYLTFYVSYQQQQLAWRQAEMQFRNDYSMLNYLCGIVDTSGVALSDPDLRMNAMPDISISPFYQQYMLDSLKFLNQRTAINFSYKPRLNVYADAGYNSSLMFDFYKNWGASAGLNLTIPIYDGKQRQLKYKKIDIAERTRQGYKDFFLKQYDQQVAQLKQQLNATESLISEIDGQIKYASTLVDVNKKLLETGEIRITDLILSINTFLNARHLLNQNYINRLQIINQINYWETI